MGDLSFEVCDIKKKVFGGDFIFGIFRKVKKLGTYCNYEWHCIDHLKDEGNLENLLKNVSLKQNNYQNNYPMVWSLLMENTHFFISKVQAAITASIMLLV